MDFPERAGANFSSDIVSATESTGFVEGLVRLQPAYLNLRELRPEFPPDQFTDDLPRPQPEVKLQLPQVAPGDNRVQLRQLCWAHSGSRPRRLLRLQCDRAALVIFLLPPEEHCPGNTEHSRDYGRFVSLFEKPDGSEPLFRCRASSFQRHKHNISGEQAQSLQTHELISKCERNYAVTGYNGGGNGARNLLRTSSRCIDCALEKRA
jgi:hypothetical protein